MFEGFSQEGVDFFWQLRLNNSREWFQPRKEQYHTLLEDPMRQFGLELREEMGRRWPKLPLHLKLSRIYRDARRLHGRGPYKESLWLVLLQPGDEERNVPGFYCELGPRGFSTGMGFYQAPPLYMAKLRARIDRDPAPLEKLARVLNRQDRFALDGELYRRPKGEKGPLLNPWYNRKNFSIDWERPCEGSVFTSALVGETAGGLDFLMPFYQYLYALDSDPVPEGF